LGEGEVKLDEERLQTAMQEERKRKAWMEDGDRGKKKKYNNDIGGGGLEVTEEELGEFTNFSYVLALNVIDLTLQRRTDGIG
jgi:hypothetical protein